MKNRNFLWITLMTLCVNLQLSLGQSGPETTLAILPFQSIGLDEVTILSAESLLRHDIEKTGNVNLVPAAQVEAAMGNQACTEIPCAIEIGNSLHADEAVLVKLVTLGEKVIVEYKLIDVTGRKVLLLDQITSERVEDLDVTMDRVAASVVRRQPVEKTAEVGSITENETLTPRRRSTRKFAGFSFGYLFPQEGYDDSDRSFAMDFRSGAEINDYSVGMQLAIRKGFAANVFGSYLFSKTDICPYLGGAFGFHWVTHTHYYYDEFGYQSEKKKRGDGFELIANGGLLAFRTYNLQLMVNLSWAYTLNDYNDQALIFTIGLIR